MARIRWRRKSIGEERNCFRRATKRRKRRTVTGSRCLKRRQRVTPRSSLLPHRMSDGRILQARERKKKHAKRPPASSAKRLPPCVLLCH